MRFEFQKIATIQSPFKTKFGTPRQSGLVPSSVSEIILEPHLQPELAFQGLNEFSHIWIVFVFHQNTNKIYRPKVHPPRLGGDTIGVFASRSPHRPNPIGLSLVKIEEIKNHSLFVSGADLVDGTPIIDIKPYLPNVESIPHAKSGWTERALQPALNIEFSSEAEHFLAKNKNLKQLIIETLKNDPRPTVYKKIDDKGQLLRENHALYLDRYDVHFRVNNQTAFVESIFDAHSNPPSGQ